MARRSGLGRGLGALIPTGPEGTVDLRSGDAQSDLQELAISSITANTYQPRQQFDEEALDTLTASVRELGVLQPVLVRRSAEGQYELIAGERRLRAATRAGLQTIPAIVRSAENKAALEQALVENLHREDLNALEEAAAYQQLVDEFGLTHEEVSERVGKSRTAVSNTVRLLGLPTGIQRHVSEGRLSAGHARALLGTDDHAFQESLAKRAIAENLPVRAVEDAVREREGTTKPSSKKAASRSGAGAGARPAGLIELENLLADHLATRVKIDMGNNKGHMTIDFADLDDLERIYQAMTESTN